MSGTYTSIILDCWLISFYRITHKSRDKHGTCTTVNPKLGTVFNYFNATLALFKTYNVQQWLEEESILPTSAKSYKLSTILNTIESRLGNKRIKVECDTFTHKKENCDQSMLDSIDICFDKMTLKPIDCPNDSKKYRKTKCDKDVYYFRLKEDLDTLKFQ